MTRKKAATAKKTAAKTGAKAETQTTAVQEALQVTWLLKGKLKSERMAYLKIGALLVHVRDDNLFGELKHPTIEDYAQERLKLGRASLYRYLQVYDWAREFHPDWLQPKPEGFIPEFSDADDLMWIERTLKDTPLSKTASAELQAMRAKGLAGDLKEGELEKWRKKGGRLPAGLKTFLSNVRLMRRRAAQVKDMPAEAFNLMDSLIAVLDNTVKAHPQESTVS